jgi:hypothetical protein
MPIEQTVDVGPPVATFFARALARDREQRFASAEEMAAALRGLALAPGPHRARTPSSAPTLATGQGYQRPPSQPPPAAFATSAPTLPQQPAFATSAPTLPQQPPFATTAPTLPASPARGRTIVLAIAAAAVIAGAVAIGVFAGRSTPADKVAVADAAVIVPLAADAAVALPRTDPTCTAACEKLATCGLDFDRAGCATLCGGGRIPTAAIAEARDCRAAALSLIAQRCGKAPAGASSCQHATECFGQCGMLDRHECECLCASKLRPQSVELWVSSRACLDAIAKLDKAAQNDCMRRTSLCVYDRD